MTFKLPSLSSLSTAERQIVGLLAGAVGLIVALAVIRAHIRADAVRDFQAKAESDSLKQERQAVAKAALDAQKAAEDVQTARDKAQAQIARQKADSARQDSIVRQSMYVRDSALAVLADSSASAPVLRASLRDMVDRVSRDSVALASAEASAARTTAALVTVVQSDSTALTASQRQVASLQALNASLSRKLSLTQAQQPSWLSEHVGLGAGYGCTLNTGRGYCGPTVAAIVRVVP